MRQTDDGTMPQIKTQMIRSVLLGIALCQLLLTSFSIADDTTNVPWMSILSLAIIVWCLVTLLFIFLVRDIRGIQWIEIMTLVGFSIIFLFYVHALVVWKQGYSTDEMAFDQYAASLFAKGQNPYTHSMLPSLQQYHVPEIFWSFTMGGQLVHRLSYPALSFLLYVPFLHWSNFSGAYVDAIFWVFTVWILYLALPSPYKAISLFFGACLFWVNLVPFGVTDSLFMPLLVFVAWKSKWFYEKKGMYKYMSPVVLGLSMAIKQTTWFLLPILLVSVYRETKSWRNVATYVAAVVLAFVAPNLYFIVKSPVSWFDGILAPFSSGLLPSGRGIVSVPVFYGVGGGELSLYTFAALLLLIAMVLHAWLDYERLRGILFILPSIVLFFPVRSFAQYLIDFLPLLFVATLNQSHAQKSLVPRKKWGGVIYLPFMVTLAAAMFTPSPIQVLDTGLRYSTQTDSIDAVSVTVENNTSHLVHPRVTLFKNGTYQPFWRIVNQASTLQPKSVKKFTAIPPDVENVSSVTESFYLDVFTSNPATISVSPLYTPRRWGTVLFKSGSNVTVQVVDAQGRAVHIDNYPVHIQELDRLTGAVLSVKTIMTSTSGDAIISVNSSQSRSISYQAYLGTKGETYGYSSILPWST